MIKFVIRLCYKIISILNSFTRHSNLEKENLNASIQAKRVEKWCKDKGDETLRLDYNLNENSIVFDIGGYIGEFARDIYCKYSSNIYVFEPVPEFCFQIKTRFINTPKVRIFNFGLGKRNLSTLINLEDNSSSLHTVGSKTITIEIKSFNEFIEIYNIENIDLAKINIEGAEYDLLDSIIEAKNITKIKNIQVQFHDFIFTDGSQRMREIQSRLSQTHILTYKYEFVWENWRLK